ncbi:MAG: glycosyltransferase family 2 protein [Bdellovibrionota bacterium]
MSKSISVIIPVYNEEDNVEPGYKELTSILQRMNCLYELIYIDDGSKDRTLSRLLDISAQDSNVKVIEFRRNFGQTAAMAAGLDYAQYDLVATLDGDMQNDPAELPMMAAKIEEGYDIVAGWRKHRQDKLVSRKIPSKIANWLISKSTNVQLHDYGCTLKVMKKDLAKQIKLYGEMHRFIPALAAEIGAKMIEVPVNHRARQFGTTKYGISRTLRVVLDLLTVKFLLGFSKRPIHLFGTIGLISGALGALILSMMTIQKIFLSIPMGSRPLLSLGVMMIIIGLQFLVFGLLAEVLARTYYESQDKKIYAVRDVHQSIQINEDSSEWQRKAAN